MGYIRATGLTKVLIKHHIVVDDFLSVAVMGVQIGIVKVLDNFNKTLVSFEQYQHAGFVMTLCVLVSSGRIRSQNSINANVKCKTLPNGSASR